MKDTTTLQPGEIIRVVPQPPATGFDAIVEDIDRDGYVLVRFKTRGGMVRDWVTPDMVEVPR